MKSSLQNVLTFKPNFPLFYLFFEDYLLERESAHGGGAGERESQADTLLRAEPDAGLDPRTLGS